MQIGYSVSTLLANIIKQAQNITSEAQWMKYYACLQENKDQIADIEDTVFCIEQALVAIKENLEYLKGDEM